MINDYNANTPEGHSYHQSEARKEEGCAAVIVPDEDMRLRVVVRLALQLRFEHKTNRQWANWYAGGLETMQTI